MTSEAAKEITAYLTARVLKETEPERQIGELARIYKTYPLHIFRAVTTQITEMDENNG